MKKLGAKRLTALYDHMCSHPKTIKIGFKDAGKLYKVWQIKCPNNYVFTCIITTLRT